MIIPYFKFQIHKDEFGTYHLMPLCRYLHNDAWSCIFETPDGCEVKLIHPTDSTYGYLGYALRYKDYDNEDGIVLLSSSTGLIPWGVGRAKGSKDAFIFRLSVDNTFEVFIFSRMADQSYQLLMSVQDGTRGIREEMDKALEEVEYYKLLGYAD